MQNSDRASSPHRGQLLRDYSFQQTDGHLLMLSDFRGRSNLVLIMLPGPTNPSDAHLLQSLGEKSDEVRENETRVLVATYPEHLPTVVNLGGDFVFLSDEQGSAMLELGASVTPAVYVTDKFREVIARYFVDESHSLPNADEILSWVRYSESQCPECYPPEWPTEDAA